MRARQTAAICLTAALALASTDGAVAQKFSRGPSSNIGVSRPAGRP